MNINRAMKTIICLLLLPVILSILLVATVTFADSENGSRRIQINEKNFPDQYLRKYLKNNYDLDRDGYIDDSGSITAFQCRHNKITDLSGLELFPNLKELDLDLKGLIELDVSGLEALEKLKVHGLSIISVNLGEARKLQDIYLMNKKMTELRISAPCPAQTVNIDSCRLVSFDGSFFPEAKTIYLYSAVPITSLELSQNQKLEKLWARRVCIKKLDFSANDQLRDVWMQKSDIEEINISRNTDLESLDIESKNLLKIDVSSNHKLFGLGITSKKIHTLDLSSNPVLQGLSVSSSQITQLDLSNQSDLRYLDLKDNRRLKKMNFKGTKSLYLVRLKGNVLEELDLSRAGNELKEIWAADNRLKRVTIPKNKCKNLDTLYLDNNRLKQIELPQKSKLAYVGLSGNQFEELDLSQLNLLRELWLENNPRLRVVYVHPACYSKKYKRIRKSIHHLVDDGVKVKIKK